MKDILKNLMNLDKPVLTEKLAPKIAPYTNIIYLIVLIILGLATVSISGLLLAGYIFTFLGAFFCIIVQFAIVRMFCEYLQSTRSDKK